jgi:hypothetical protein
MDPNSNNYAVFRECLSAAIVEGSAEKPSKASRRRRPKRATSPPPARTSTRTDPEDLAEFIDVSVSISIYLDSLAQIHNTAKTNPGD